MSSTNPLWGAPRIHGELLKLGIEISQATVAKYMVRSRGTPSPTWCSFLRNEALGIAAIDMFIVPSVTIPAPVCDAHHVSDSPSASTAFLSRRFSSISSQQFLELMAIRWQALDFIAGRFTCGIASQPLFARLQEVLGPAIVEVLVNPSLRHSSATLSSPRKPAITIRTLSSAEKCRRVARLMSRTAFSASSDCVSIFDPIFRSFRGYR
jgi:hypothetical protein